MPAPIARAAAGLAAALALTSSISDSIEDWALALALSRSASLASSASCFRVSVNSAAVAGDRSVERSLPSFGPGGFDLSLQLVQTGFNHD
jgi:hypothetical protein